MIQPATALAHETSLHALWFVIGFMLGLFAALVLLAFLRAASEEPPGPPDRDWREPMYDAPLRRDRSAANGSTTTPRGAA